MSMSHGCGRGSDPRLLPVRGLGGIFSVGPAVAAGSAHPVPISVTALFPAASGRIVRSTAAVLPAPPLIAILAAVLSGLEVALALAVDHLLKTYW
jgi:hypothetical protein